MAKICFVCLYAYSLFNRSTRYEFGGSEVRCWLFATRLSKFSEYDISVIVLDHKQPQVEQYGHIKVYRHSYYKSYLGLLDRLCQRYQQDVPH